jgi:hypothetical protein
MADIAYGLLTFENEQVLVYEVRADPTTELESTIIIFREDPDGWRFFGAAFAARHANAIYSKAKRAASSGEWPKNLAFCS